MQAGARRSGTAIVAGAGISGLAAAAALAPLFETVTIVEKDRLPAEPEPRKGVAQGLHVHVFLIGGLDDLERLFPGVLDELGAAGGVPVELGLDLEMFDYGRPRPKRRLGLRMICLSRPAYEHVLRGRIAGLPNVMIETGAKVAGIHLEDGQAAGLVLADGVVRHADFVVDATGRGAALAAQLAREGYGEAPEIRIGIDMCYASARFRFADRWAGAAAALCMPTPPDKRFGVTLPIEGGEHVVSLGGRCGVEPPTDLAGFLDYARRMASPAIYERLADAEPVGEIQRYRKPTADWRRYDRLARFPGRLAPVGDTIASFNPTWGQGMTVAVRHALALGDALRRVGPAEGFAAAYLQAAAAASEQAWSSAALVDLAYSEVWGDRPPDLAESLAFLQGLRAVSDEDPAVHRLWIEVVQMARPAQDLHDPALVARVMAALAPSAGAGPAPIRT